MLGSGCPTCKALYDKVAAISEDIDSILEVEYITGITKLVELGVMTSPAFAIDNQIIVTGRSPDEDEIKDAILDKLNS